MMKKITFAMLVFLALSQISIAKTLTVSVDSAVPALPLTTDSQAFAKQYPNIANALQVDLYTQNLVGSNAYRSMYTDNKEEYSALQR